MRSTAATRRDELLAFLHARGGVARSAAARLAGFSERTMVDAVASGAIDRIRRSWLALPELHPELREAARRGVVLSCVTQARREGLWVLAEPEPHAAASAHAGRIDSRGIVVHRARPLVPRQPDHLVDPIENVLHLLAHCLPLEQALAVYDSARNTRMVPAGFERLPLSSRAREVWDASTPYADSGLETFVPVRLRWMRLRIVPQAWIAGHRVDFLIGERLVLQIDGGHHVGAQREQDIRHDAQLLLMGYVVIRVGYRQVVDDWPSVQHAISRAVAQGLHLARA